MKGVLREQQGSMEPYSVKCLEQQMGAKDGLV